MKLSESRFCLMALLGSVLVACGGSGNSGPPKIVLSPKTASVAVGATIQFKAAITDVVVPVVWSVDNVVGGNSSIGTITQTGLYTAPSIPPATQPVEITLAAQYPAISPNPPLFVSDTATLTVTYADLSLRGEFILNVTLTDGTHPKAIVGLLNADGHGSLVGSVDINSQSGVSSSVGVTGSYAINSDGSGILSVNAGGVGLYSFNLVISTGGMVVMASSVASATGTATLSPAAAVPTTLSTLKGNYVFTVRGLPNSGVTINDIGQVALDGAGNVNAGDEDYNNLVTVGSAHGLTGNYTMGTSQRGTLTLHVGGGTQHYAFYAASPMDFQLISLDSGVVATGAADQQTATALSGNDVAYRLYGSDASGNPDGVIADFDYSSKGTMGFFENDNGTGGGSGTTGVPSSPPSGSRGTMTLPSGAFPVPSRTFVYYIRSATSLVVLETDTNGDMMGAGNVVQPTFGIPLSPGQYAFSGFNVADNTSMQIPFIGIVVISENGMISGYEYQQTGGIISKVNISGTSKDAGVDVFGSQPIVKIDTANSGTITYDFAGLAGSGEPQLGLDEGLFAGVGGTNPDVSLCDLLPQFQSPWQ